MRRAYGASFEALTGYLQKKKQKKGNPAGLPFLIP
jgi:hypothetical protein